MSFKQTTGAFKDWQCKQRELQSLEALLAGVGANHNVELGRDLHAGLDLRAQVLRQEIEQLFQPAMEELEANVRRLKDRKPRRHKSTSPSTTGGPSPSDRRA